MNGKQYEGRPERVRVYGRTLREWRTKDEQGRDLLQQSEIAYHEIEADTGRTVCRGSEDFTPERLKLDTIRAAAFVWYGDRYPSGRRVWVEVGAGRIRRGDRAALRRLISSREGGAALAVDIRTY